MPAHGLERSDNPGNAIAESVQTLEALARIANLFANAFSVRARCFLVYPG